MRTTLVLLMALVGVAAAEPTTRPAPDFPELDGDAFRLVVLPDTQVYSWGHPHVFAAQTRWVAENADELGIAFVTHVGDVVDGGGDARQWASADAAIGHLDDAGVPYSILPGNHDWARTGDRTTNLDSYLATFGPHRFEGKTWYRGHMPGRPGNTYQVFDAGGREMLHVGLEWRHDFATDPDLGILDWANAVLADHPGLPTIVTTHEDLRDEGRDGTPGGVTAPGQLLFDELVTHHRQVFLVLSGHNHFGYRRLNENGEWRQTSTNAAGDPVYRLMTTFQDWRPEESPTGGEGFLRVLRFEPERDRVVVRTYSPFRDQELTDAEGPAASAFSFPLDLDGERFAR